MNRTELRATVSLALVMSTRLLGLFMIYPTFAVDARHLPGATPAAIGLALGAYGLAQGLLQIPYGLLSDRIGRKTVITAGLVLFAAGSVVAALATSIEGILLGRLLQGAGAIGSSTLALVADLTRDEVRTRAMAVVGLAIGLSFVVAFIVGPPLDALGGLSGLFWATAGLALLGVTTVWLVVPTPQRRSAPISRSRFGQVLREPTLRRLDFGIFALHALLTASFLVVPSLMIRAWPQASGANEFKIYLPVMAASVVLMLAAVFLAEARRLMRPVFVTAIAAIGVALLVIAAFGASAAPLAVALTLFFAAFNAMEAMLPSLVTKVAAADSKGAATGVYSSAQYLGIFAGGAGGGWLMGVGGEPVVIAAAVLLTLVWLAVASQMRFPEARATHEAKAAAAP